MVKTGGTHTVSVDVRGQAGDIKSADQPFNVDLQPPNPIFVSPDAANRPPPAGGRPLQRKGAYCPRTQKIDIIIEFPDRHKRPLVRTTLYVDGQIIAENKAAPFDSFTWDLQAYKVSGEHKLSVEAVDSLNLSKTSMEIPVTVTVIEPPHGVSAFFGRYRQTSPSARSGLPALVLLLDPVHGRASVWLSCAGARSSWRKPTLSPSPSKWCVERLVEKSNGKEPGRNGPARLLRTAMATVVHPPRSLLTSSA